MVVLVTTEFSPSFAIRLPTQADEQVPVSNVQSGSIGLRQT